MSEGSYIDYNRVFFENRRGNAKGGCGGLNYHIGLFNRDINRMMYDDLCALERQPVQTVRPRRIRQLSSSVILLPYPDSFFVQLISFFSNFWGFTGSLLGVILGGWVAWVLEMLLVIKRFRLDYLRNTPQAQVRSWPSHGHIKYGELN